MHMESATVVGNSIPRKSSRLLVVITIALHAISKLSEIDEKIRVNKMVELVDECNNILGDIAYMMEDGADKKALILAMLELRANVLCENFDKASKQATVLYRKFDKMLMEGKFNDAGSHDD